MQEWVDAHPPGTPIVAHYDPANHKKAVTGDDRYAAGWSADAEQLEAAGILCRKFRAVLAIARIMRPSSGVAAGGQ